MSDRELLEFAAKAAGIEDYYVSEWTGGASIMLSPDPSKGPVEWDPLADDGDALRLAVKLNIGVMSAQYTGRTMAWLYCQGIDGEFFEPHGDDIAAATRRAIVRAAAHIGKAKS